MPTLLIERAICTLEYVRVQIQLNKELFVFLPRRDPTLLVRKIGINSQ